MEAAVLALRSLGAARIVAAAPVAASSARERLQRSADAVVCVSEPTWFQSVGQWYENFEQTEDAEVEQLLSASRHPVGREGTPC